MRAGGANVEQRLSLGAFVGGGQHRDARARQRPIRGRQPARQLGEALAAPLLAAPIRRRPDRQHRPAGLEQHLGLGVVLGREPKPRAGRRIEVEQAGELAHAMLARIALGCRPAVAGAQQPWQRRAAQIDDNVPAPSRHGPIQPKPVRGHTPLFHHDQAFQPRHRLEQRRRDRAGGDGQPGARMALDQVREQPCR